jgi:NadR type nicotinamide-nucleotide adenylyltransferase
LTLGLVVGKFYPPHRGHKHLIDTARSQCDHLVVLLPAHPSQTIAGELRKAWLREIHPSCDIHLVPDELENDSQQWATFTLAHLGRAPDLVFSSEEYGPVYASLMGSRHVMVDRARSAVPISGSAIRNSPLDHLDFLEPCVRAYYVRRIVLIGAESTGKTTLARLLAEDFHTMWVPEFGREYWERKIAGLPIGGPLPPFTDDEFITIAAEQQRRENLAARSANKLLFCDTNAFATGTWCERYQGHRHPLVDALGQRDTVHLYLLTHPDFPFVQDGYRDGEHFREWMHTRFAEQLSQQSIPVTHLHGSPAQRRATASAAIQDLIAAFRPHR